MSIILGVAAAVIAFIVAAGLSAATKLIEEEIKGWLEVLPGIVLRMAAMQLDAKQRVSVYRDEWLPELLFIARNTESRPITRFVTGMRFSLGLLRSSRRVARDLRRSLQRGPAAVRPQFGIATRIRRVWPGFTIRQLVEGAARQSGQKGSDCHLTAAAAMDRLALGAWAEVSLRLAPDEVQRRARLAAVSVQELQLLS